MRAQFPRNTMSTGIVDKDAVSLDTTWLSSWIQAQHLEADAVKEYRDAFASHPANMVVLKNFLTDQIASRLSCFASTEAEFETLFGLYSTMEKSSSGLANVTESEWLNADEQDRFFRLRKFVRISPQRQLTPNLATYLSFLSGFNDPRFRHFFKHITGLEYDLKNATHHLFTYKRGDFLRSHTDRAGKYLLAFVLYLTPAWETRFGGTLSVVMPGAKVIEVEPEYNSIVLFNVERQAEHFVSAIEDCAGEISRSTFSGWLHKPF